MKVDVCSKDSIHVDPNTTSDLLEYNARKNVLVIESFDVEKTKRHNAGIASLIVAAFVDFICQDA